MTVTTAAAGSVTGLLEGGAAGAGGRRDRSGNGGEWVEEGDRDTWGRGPSDGAGQKEAGASLRMCRGGGWVDGARDCRSANRYRVVPGRRGSRLGFRPTRSLP